MHAAYLDTFNMLNNGTHTTIKIPRTIHQLLLKLLEEILQRL